MSGNQLYAYDLTAEGDVLPGRRLGPLSAGAKATDCRAMCVGPDGTVWAGVAVTTAKGGQLLHVVRYRPGDPAPVDLGPIAIGNPDYTTFVDAGGKEKPYHHGVFRLKDGTLVPRYVIMGICAATDGTVYLTTLYPFTVHAIRVPRVAGIATRLLSQLARRHDHRPPAPDRYPRRQGAPDLDRAGLALHRPGARDRHRPEPGAQAGRPGL